MQTKGFGTHGFRHVLWACLVHWWRPGFKVRWANRHKDWERPYFTVDWKED